MDGRHGADVEYSSEMTSPDTDGRDAAASNEKQSHFLADYLNDLTQWWGEGVAVTLIVLVVMGVLARGLTTLGLLYWGLPGSIVVAVVLSALCVLQLTGVVVAFVRAGSGQHGTAWQMGNLILVLMSLGLYVETFASVTVCLWRGAGQHVGPWSDLWNAESFYLWQVVRSIPLLDITGTVHWREPAYGAAHTPGGLVLAFKVLVILPLIQAAISGYRLAVERVTVESSSERFLHQTQSRQKSGLLDIVRMAAAVGVVGYGVTWLASQVFNGDSAFNGWWTRTAMPAIHAGGSSWLAVVPWILLTIAGLLVLYWAVHSVREQAFFHRHGWSWWMTGTAVIAALAALYGAILWDAGLLLTLARLDLGVDLPDTTGPLTVMQALAWHVVHMLPGLDVTGTLHWTAPVALAGGAASWLVLALKVFFLGMLVFVGVPVVRTVIVWTRYGPVIDAWSAMRDVAMFVRFRTPGESLGYERVRELLHWTAQDLAARPRFAVLAPPLQAFRGTLPEGESALTRADVADALTAFRIGVVDHVPGAASYVEWPAWLEVDGESARTSA